MVEETNRKTPKGDPDAWLWSDEAFEVLGWPNFRCARFAELFRLTGETIQRRAEAEQAFIIRWLLTLVRDCGPDWEKAANLELKRRSDFLLAAADAESPQPAAPP